MDAIIVSFNTAKLLRECVESLKKHTENLNNIIVVDNGSKDGSREWLAMQDSVISVFNNGPKTILFCESIFKII